MNSILNEAEEHHRLQHVNINTLNVIVELCKNFEIILKELQTCRSASLCFVLPSIHKVKSLCEPNISVITAILVLKDNINRNVREIWRKNLSIWHKVAFFLYSPAISLQLEDLNEIKEFCILQIEKLDNNIAVFTSSVSLNSNLLPVQSNSGGMATSSSSPNIDSPIHKNKFFFSNLLQKSTNDHETPFMGVEKYCTEKVIITEDSK